jgi:hypothetical protein
MTMNEKKGVPAADSAASIGYIMYAYLGGQAKRDIMNASGNCRKSL